MACIPAFTTHSADNDSPCRMLFGFGVTLHVDHHDEVSLSIIDIDLLVEQLVTEKVKVKLQQHNMLRWPNPPLFMMCSEVCWQIKKELIREYVGITAHVRNGVWLGTVDFNFMNNLARQGLVLKRPLEHTWLEVEFRGVVLKLDPTFLQFRSADSEWSYIRCMIEAQNCSVLTIARR